ncbi:MAG: ubiquinol-cytochrome c reductase iron-sulfur subunit [Chloroflexi bacterium]|nr:MAG: ubiquinol-cytochrome c reductase iron-sulfur subunit [Chloroflexota bacterium]
MANAAIDAKVKSGGISRREFLYYIWGASLALFTAEFAGLLIWFLIPKFREGEFGGKFTLPIDEIPEVNAEPADKPEGRFWLVQLDTSNSDGEERMYRAEDEDQDIKGVAAVYKVCTHLGCIYSWNGPNQRFECPCHGSKYRLDGRRIEAPAPRALDRFKVEILNANREVIAESELVDDFYQPVELPSDAAFISVDTGDRKEGPEGQELLCEFSGNCP